MRIAYFTETFLPQIDGIVFILTHLFDYLKENGHESIAFAPLGTLDTYASTKVFHQTSLRMPFYPERRLATPLARVEKKVLDFQPDLIHLVSPTSLGVAGFRVALKHSIPLVASYHADLSGFARRLKIGVLSEPIYRFFRYVHNKADLTLVPSEFTRQQLAAKDFHRLSIWPSGVDLQLFSPAKRSEAWRTRLSEGHNEEVLITFVSRLSREKRADMLLPIACELTGVRLAIVGDGPDRGRLERLFAGTPTHFAGYLRGEELAAAFAAGDLFVFTGAEETFGNVVLEAMASGLPVIAPDSGGVVNLVSHGETGFLFPSENNSEMTRLAAQLAADPQLAKRMGRAGRARAENYGWEDIFTKLIDDYNGVLRIHR
ncbi:MAG TPA: glycosyltransferase family 1 protein [Anaerolineales bacterium]|nr:glycosyltransferase family 1 protein [Anaerolineales bacterium]